MNQDKTGKFIAKCRKDKNMTQEQLAEKMGVSINAVSKWERGLSFPDVSLYKKLCKELGINIEELINGEKDKSEEAKEKAIISTIKETKKIKKNSKKLLITISAVFLIIVVALIYYNIKLKVDLVNDSDFLYDEVINFIRERILKRILILNIRISMYFIVIMDLELKREIVINMYICGYMNKAIILNQKNMEEH